MLGPKIKMNEILARYPAPPHCRMSVERILRTAQRRRTVAVGRIRYVKAGISKVRQFGLDNPYMTCLAFKVLLGETLRHAELARSINASARKKAA